MLAFTSLPSETVVKRAPDGAWPAAGETMTAARSSTSDMYPSRFLKYSPFGLGRSRPVRDSVPPPPVAPRLPPLRRVVTTCRRSRAVRGTEALEAAHRVGRPRLASARQEKRKGLGS